MKLILTSADLSSDEIYNKTVELVGKPAESISVAVLIEASAVEEGDKKWLINGLFRLTAQFFGEIDIVNLLALKLCEIKKRLQKADIIYCFGGSTEWLKKVFDKTGLASELPKLLEEKVWVGSSAGSMVLGKMPSTETQSYIYGMDNYYGVDKYLELVNFSILPHIFGSHVPLDSFQKCLEESQNQSYPVYVLSDESAVVVDNDKTYLVGKKCFKLIAGEVVEQR